MSDAPPVRRTDKLMTDARAREMLRGGHTGRLATVGANGAPYIVPLLYVCIEDEVWVHNTGARGHLRTNVAHETRVCFEVDEPGAVYPYGRFACDTTIAYCSVIVFGRIRIVDEPARKAAFFDALMKKYGDPGWDRPEGFYPRLGEVTVYAVSVERLTGKEMALPALAARWPAVDGTKTPQAVPPAEHFMHRALVEGRRALPACLPNPPVGCVLVSGGTVVATGFTNAPGAPHAEAMALAQLPDGIDDVTAFVTLEPCSFHGRTPSCADALVARGIRRVVVAIVDPDPRNDGAGIARLRAAGVEVTLGVLANEAAIDLGPHLALAANRSTQ
jgi:pyrimidine deaminase RibD-like protein/nitroimidazol reductase NimA-like FMN-containing flavoprotein (pyridoxamine 5'-phosphate oxidase superfamily)